MKEIKGYDPKFKIHPSSTVLECMEVLNISYPDFKKLVPDKCHKELDDFIYNNGGLTAPLYDIFAKHLQLDKTGLKNMMNDYENSPYPDLEDIG